jgi:hypothetical protein
MTHKQKSVKLLKTSPQTAWLTAGDLTNSIDSDILQDQLINRVRTVLTFENLTGSSTNQHGKKNTDFLEIILHIVFYVCQVAVE